MTSNHCGEAHTLGYYTNLITSGIGLTEERIKALKAAASISILVSGDRSSEKNNNKKKKKKKKKTHNISTYCRRLCCTDI